MTSTPDTRRFDHHPLPREQWPAFVGKRSDAELALSRDLPAAEQLRLARSHRPRVRAVLAGNPSIDADLQRVLMQDGAAVAVLAGNPGLCGEVQQELLALGEPRLIRAMASSAVLAPAVRDAVAGSPKYRAALARNPNLPREMYRHLLREGEAAVRLALAGNWAAPTEVVLAAAGDRREDVRHRAATNPVLPASAQERLALGHDPAVRQMLAINPSLAPSVQRILVRDPEVVLHLAGNPALTPESVDALLQIADRVGFRLAGRPGLDLHQQRRLADADEAATPIRLASNPCLHPELQRRFGADPSWTIRAALSRNPGLHSDVQLHLAGQDDPHLRARLIANPALDRPALRILLDARAAGRWRWHPDDAPRAPALGLATHWTPASLDHPVLGPLVALLTGKPGVLSAAAAHPDPLVRWALVGNDRIGADRLGRLLTDAEPAIAAGARVRFLSGLAG